MVYSWYIYIIYIYITKVKVVYKPTYHLGDPPVGLVLIERRSRLQPSSVDAGHHFRGVFLFVKLVIRFHHSVVRFGGSASLGNMGIHVWFVSSNIRYTIHQSWILRFLTLYFLEGLILRREHKGLKCSQQGLLRHVTARGLQKREEIHSFAKVAME